MKLFSESTALVTGRSVKGEEDGKCILGPIFEDP